MDIGRSILFGLTLIALAVIVSDAMRPANAGLMGGGRYMGVPAGPNSWSVWVVDTESGRARICGGLKNTCKPWLK